MNRHFSRPCDARPNRAARRFAFSILRRTERRQRRGQALILAVLVMLMIALVSAGFLVVVSGNLNQTARATDKSRAVEAARSGLRYVNEQLTYSRLGENWRPGFKTTGNATQDKALLAEGESLMPQPGSLSYNLYYSSVERANGWAGSFAKFPDPLAPRNDSPQYLARVQRIPGELDPGDLDASDPNKQGALKITIIGLSPDDPAAFHKSVAYKGGQSAPVGRFMRTVTNWDFKNKVVPSGEVASFTGTQLTLQNTSGVFPPVPFTVMIGNPQVAAPLRGAVVTDVTGSVLTLAAVPTTAPVAGERVEVAAQIGAPKPLLDAASTDLNKDATAVDFNLDGTINVGTEKADLAVSDITTSKPGSVFVNGSALLVGNVNALNLRGTGSNTSPTDLADPAKQRSNFQVTGLVAQDASVTSSAVTVAGTDQSGNTVSQPLVLSSNDTNFPFASGLPVDKDSLVSDGFNRLNNQGGDLRAAAPVPAPDIASGAGVARYRRLAREDDTLINNPTDRERFWDGAKLRDMTQAELIGMWLSRQADGSEATDTDCRFYRAVTPAPATDDKASLEEQHLRGWVGPDEFRARGALVELFNDASDGNKPKIAVTLDSRSDNSAAALYNAYGPVNAKAWRDANGDIEKGVYRRVFDWPSNGVVFAEGNVRIRGTIDDTKGAAPRSLTVVSQNNIYIDGSVGAGAKKVLLLARKNVVANPTAVVQRLDAQTVVTGNLTLTAGTPGTVAVGNSSDFRPGDVVETVDPTAPTTLKVVAVVDGIPSANSLSLRSLPGLGTSIVVDDTLRARHDAVENGRPVLASPTDVVQRRLQVQNAANLRIALYHNADRIPALKIETEDATTGTKPTTPFAFLSNKRATTDFIDVGDKKMQGDYTQPTAGNDLFPATAHSTDADANGYDLTTLKAAMEGTTHSNGTTGWKYKITLSPLVPANVPAFYLAGVGARNDFNKPVPTGAIDFRADISTTAHDVPLATSVQTILNGGAVALTGFDTPANTATGFGFNPAYTPLTSTEDINTNERGFYQGAGASDTAANNATLDSRQLPNPNVGENTLVLRQSTGIVAGTTLPTYRAGNMKLESVDAATGAVTPGYTMNISAFVYAQSGSWFVIPAAPADPLIRDDVRLRGDESKSYLDLNDSGTADIGEYVDADANSAFSAGDCADLNRDGKVNPGEVSAYIRYARTNYRLNFVGAIAENQTALVNPVGTMPGAVQAWSNSWASYTATPGAISNQVAGVNYTFDPSYADGTLLSDAGFVMPQSNELTYVE